MRGGGRGRPLVASEGTMAEILSCARGHHWAGGDKPDAACPVCGGPAVDGKDTVELQPPSSSFDGPVAPVLPEDVTLPPADAPPPGARPSVPGYEILSELGRGGMGVVYKARHLALNRVVALKMILAGSHAGRQERERFRTEAEAAARLHHPNIVQIFEVGESAGCPYLALEYVDGGNLAAHRPDAPWPHAEAAALVETLAQAVEHAH